MTTTMRAAALAAMIPGAALAQDCEVTAGVVMELTGPAGQYGQAGAKSVEMAFRDINEAGGVAGCDLAADIRDSQSQGTVAVDQAPPARGRPGRAPSSSAASSPRCRSRS